VTTFLCPLLGNGVIVMLERYYALPSTADRIRALWLGPAIERYAVWLAERRISGARGRGCIAVLIQFNCFAQAHGARDWSSLPEQVAPFIASRMRRQRRSRDRHELQTRRSQFRVPVEQLLRLVIAGYVGTVRRSPWPFSTIAPHFPDYLRDERGLRWPSIGGYAGHLRALQRYLARTGVGKLSQLTPRLISGFLTAHARHVRGHQVVRCAGNLRVFLRYLHRERILPKDLSRSVPRGRVYQSAAVPRAIPWTDVERAVMGIDRRSAVGKRDYAILLLLTTYGLRANEVASLKLDNLDWRAAQMRIVERKAGNTTVYPLAGTVGDAIITYLREARPECSDRHVFLTVRAPFRPLVYWDVSQRAAWHLRRAGVRIPRVGSHTLRHSCVQHLVDADVPFKVIGDYIGHRTDVATQNYAKVAVHKLRALVIGEAEDIL
jgi:integrase/recombinase XerD